MGYRTLFEGSGIHQSNTHLQITHNMYINRYFSLISLLIGESEAHTSLPENGNIRIELQFNKPLPEAITCLQYLEYDSTVLQNFSRKSHDRFLMHKKDTWQILRDATSFLDVFPYDLLPSSRPVLKPCTLIVIPYRGRLTLASHTSYTPLFDCLLL